MEDENRWGKDKERHGLKGGKRKWEQKCDNWKFEVEHCPSWRKIWSKGIDLGEGGSWLQKYDKITVKNTQLEIKNDGQYKC